MWLHQYLPSVHFLILFSHHLLRRDPGAFFLSNNQYTFCKNYHITREPNKEWENTIAHKSIFTRLYMSTYPHVHAHVCTRAHIHTYTHLFVHEHTSTRTRTCLYTSTHPHVHALVCTRAHIHTYTHRFVHEHKSTRTRTRLYTSTHLHVHAHVIIQYHIYANHQVVNPNDVTNFQKNDSLLYSGPSGMITSTNFSGRFYSFKWLSGYCYKQKTTSYVLWLGQQRIKAL